MSDQATLSKPEAPPEPDKRAGKKTGRYEEGARNRQDALDYINKNPGAIAPVIIEALGWGKVSGATRLAKMSSSSRCELTRKPEWFEGVDSLGRRFVQKTYAYQALVTKTSLPDGVVDPEPEDRPWVTRNDPSKHAPIKNQDGQGSLCPLCCGIKSTLG